VPVWEDKSAANTLTVLVRGDPAMRRPYVVLIADARTYPKSDQAGAKALSIWMDRRAGADLPARLHAATSGDDQPFFPMADETDKKPQQSE
jgi:ABC-type tungstate transport system permease subunit